MKRYINNGIIIIIIIIVFVIVVVVVWVVSEDYEVFCRRIGQVYSTSLRDILVHSTLTSRANDTQATPTGTSDCTGRTATIINASGDVTPVLS